MKKKQPHDKTMDTGEVINRKEKQSLSSYSRRAFLAGIGGAAALSALGLPPVVLLNCAEAKADEIGPLNAQQRRNKAYKIRHEAAIYQKNLSLPDHPDNGEEKDYPYLANFSKGLPHNNFGEVDPDAYQALLDALSVGDDASFEHIPLGGVRPLRNPQAGIAFDLVGPDSHHLKIRPAPRIDEPENSGEMAELYWMALARDVNFTDYDNDSLIIDACTDLSAFSDFRGPKQSDSVTPATIFRGNTLMFIHIFSFPQRIAPGELD